MSGLRIGVDVDDVLFPWFNRAHAACETAGITNGVYPSRWECYLDYGVTLDDWLDVMRTATLDGSLYAGAPFPGAVDALRRLKEAGHTVHIVTARGFFQHGDLIRAATVEWLATNDVPHDSLTFSKDKTIVLTDYFVDDSWKNVQQLLAVGIPTWLVDAPHNKGIDYDRRVPSVAAFADVILSGAA